MRIVVQAIMANAAIHFCVTGSSAARSKRPFFNPLKGSAVTVRPDRQRRSLAGPTSGSFKPLILLVRFTDHLERDLPPREHFQTMCEDQIKPYFVEQSYGQYNIECDVKDWMDTDNTEAFYSAGNSNWQGSDLAASFFVPVLNQLDASGIDWTPYDVDFDGNLDAVLVIHSGFAAEQGNGAECGLPDPLSRIHSQGHAASQAWTSASFTTYLSGYAIAPAFDRMCPGRPASMGTMTHEWIHTFNTPDLYNLGPSGGSLGGIGLYDIMSNAYGPIGNGTASSMSVFTKNLTGWLVPTEIVADGVYTINAVLTNANAFIIRKGFAPDECLMIENRGNTSRDMGLPGQGILIYHVDNSVPLQDSPGFPGQDGWPSNGKHFRVALVQADGKYDLENSVNTADVGDYWANSMTLGPGNNGQVYPNTDSYQSGAIVPTGITISEFSAPGDSMTFRVTGLGGEASPTTSPPVAAPTEASGSGTTVAPTATTVSPTTSAPTMTVGSEPIVVTLSPTTMAPVTATTSAPTSPMEASVPTGTSMPTVLSITIQSPPPTTTPLDDDSSSTVLEITSDVPSMVPSRMPSDVPSTVPSLTPNSGGGDGTSSPRSAALAQKWSAWASVFVTAVMTSLTMSFLLSL